METTTAPTPVWLEDWRPDGHYICTPDGTCSGAFGEALDEDDEIDPFDQERDEARARLAAAAPACVRALLAVEWSVDGPEGHMQCPDCGGFQPSGIKEGDRLYYWNRSEHKREIEVAGSHACALDAALTQAGLRTDAERDEARRLLALARKLASNAAR